jgi:hypothetical protein
VAARIEAAMPGKTFGAVKALDSLTLSIPQGGAIAIAMTLVIPQKRRCVISRLCPACRPL